MYSPPPPPTLEMFMSSRPTPNRQAPPPRPAWGQPQQPPKPAWSQPLQNSPMPSSDYPSLHQAAQRTPKLMGQQPPLSRPTWSQPQQPPKPAWGLQQQPPTPSSDYPSLQQSAPITPKSLNQRPPPSKPDLGHQRQPPKSTWGQPQHLPKSVWGQPQHPPTPPSDYPSTRQSALPTKAAPNPLPQSTQPAVIQDTSSGLVKKRVYIEYVRRSKVDLDLKTVRLLQGKLRLNSLYPDQAYVSVAGLSVDVLIQGNKNRNRALNGDIVVVQLNSVAAWRPMDDEVDREMMATGEPPFATSSADTDEDVLHSLWLPTVQADQCFIMSARNDEELKMSEPSLAFINDTVRRRLRRPTASVVFILERGNSTELVGAFEPLTNGSDNAYFNPHDPRAPRRVLILRAQLPADFLAKPELYTKKMLSTCRITTWPATDKFPTGDFIKIVGEYTDIEARLSAALAKHGLQSHTLDFDSSILDELDEKYGTSGEKWEVPEDDLEKRRDFRDTQIFSIDPYNARDLDDALHITALNEARTKFEIGVHIADVTHFMEHDSLLDREARSRATSVYLANRVLPMLPRILCEKLCSLQPQVDRLAFSVVWQMNVDGTLVDGVEPWFGKSIIRSCCKLDYGSAQKMLDGVISADNVDEWEEDRRPIPGANPNITNATVIQSVKDLWSIGENRRAMRFETGAVSLNDVKLVFSLDAKGNPTRYGPYELKDSNRLVEEYMLLANYLVAQQLLRVHGPLAFLRHHPPPVQRSMGRAREQLRKYGIEMGSNPKDLMESLTRIREERGETVFALVQAILIKPMKPAQYSVAGNAESPDSWRHFALNIPYYTHFTSPIRRYADVVVHRLLQESIECPSAPATFESEYLDARLAELTSIAHTCNTKKDAAKYAKNDCDEVYLSSYLQLHGDVEVTGVVESMGSTSFTVYFPEMGMMKRLSLIDIKLKGKWDRQAAQLSICLPEEPENWIKLSFMKELRMRMSTTKSMPLVLAFTVIGESCS